MSYPSAKIRPSYDDSMVSSSQNLQKRLKKIYHRDLRSFLVEQQRRLRQQRQQLQQRQSKMMQLIPRQIQGGVHQNKCTKNRQRVVDPYQILQVRRDATRHEIRQAYRRLALWHHPHRFCEDKREKQRRSQMFTMVAAAYETLMDQQCRSRCDTILREMNQTVSSVKIPEGQIMVGKTASPLRSSPRARRRRLGSRDTLDSVLRASHSMVDSIEEEEQCAHDGNRATTPSLAEISLTDCSSDDDDNDDDEAETHKNNELISQSDDAAFTSLGSMSHPWDLQIDPSPKKQHDRTTKPRNCKIFILDCTGGESSYDESLQLPALINSSSSSKALGDGEKHFTETDTDRLFGGPLQLLFRARRWRPFTDPFIVYRNVFESQLPGSSKPDDLDNKPSSWNTNERSSSQGELWKRKTTERQPDGSVIHTQRRVFQNKRVIRQDTVWTDPATGQKYTTVSVISEPCEDHLALQQSRDTDQEQVCHGEVCALSWMDIVQSFVECTPYETELCG